MKFGVCTDANGAILAAEQGWDYIEGNVQGLFKGQQADAEYVPSIVSGQWPIPMRAANCLLPGTLKIVGETIDPAAVQTYMDRVLRRAAAAEVGTLVFGSGVARRVPEGFSREIARQQILTFLRTVGPMAQAAGVTIVIEPLNRSECNILNSVAEAMEDVRAVNHPAIRCLVDSYHFWLEDEPLANLQQALPALAHVHVADKVGRTAPGLSGQSDYNPFFSVLKRGQYQGLISVEAGSFDLAKSGSSVLAYLRQAWDQA